MYRSVKKHPCMITEYHPIYISCNQREIPRQYSQWLNSVISWLINHCMDWARTSVKSFGRQFDFHDVIYHIWHCNIDNRRCNVVFYNNMAFKMYEKHVFQSKQELREILTVCLRWRIVIDFEGFVHIFNLFVC